MQYFDHSTDAATDPKIMQLRIEHGGAAVDAYWYLLEQMHRDERCICVRNASAMRAHCHMLCATENELSEWISGMCEIGLLDRDEEGDIISIRAMRNIEAYQEKADKARSAAKSRWGDANAKRTHSKRNADAMRPHCQQNKTKGSNATKALLPTDADGAGAGVPAPPASDHSTGKGEPLCPECGKFSMRWDVSGKAWVCRDGACRGIIKDHQSPHCPLCDAEVPKATTKDPESGLVVHACPNCGPVKFTEVVWR